VTARRLRIHVARHDAGLSDPSLVLPEPLEDQVRRLAQTDVTLLLQGESGTGKSSLARHIHERSGRADRPFRRIDCGGLNSGMMEAEVFGHRKGAFTGADRDRPGLVRSADGGTIFLDEISVLDRTSQTRLLTLLEEREVRAVGGDRAEPVDVRILCATNDDLAARVRQGRMRRDLYYRCSQMTLEVPPLRERDDFREVVRHVMRTVVKEDFAVTDVTVELTDEALRRLRSHTWPGNIRELRHVLMAALLAAGLAGRGQGATVDRGHVAKALAARPAVDGLERSDGGHGPGDAERTGPGSRYAAPSSRATEREMIIEALQRAEGNKRQASRELGMHRRTLYRKIETYAIEEREWWNEADDEAG